MEAWFRSRVAIRTVACIALISSTGIVDPGTAHESCSGMAMLAIQCGCKVSWIGLGILTLRCHTIMAGFAAVNDACMIKHRSCKRTGVMTDATVLVCWYMAGSFTYSERAIMTGATVIHDTNMVKGCRSKACGLVAVTAITGGWHMVRWRGFSWGSCAIVA